LNNVRRQPVYVLTKERRNMDEQRTHESKGVVATAAGGATEQQRIRTERALSMLADGQILFQKDGALGWLAFDPEGGAHHLGPHACDCEDFTRRCAPMRIRCKHMEALRIAGRSFSISILQETGKSDPRPPGANLMELLGAPFPAEAIHWKPQKVSFQGNRALAVAYLDAREVAGRLDEVVGPLGWQVVHQILGDQLVTGIGIRDPATVSWVWKWDSGFVGRQQDDDEKGSEGSDPRRHRDDEEKSRKGTLSDGLKRAAVLWGIGRYLYRLPKVWVAYDPKTKSLADTPRLPPWALPASPREPRTRSPGEDAIPAPGENSGADGAAASSPGGRPSTSQAQCLARPEDHSRIPAAEAKLSGAAGRGEAASAACGQAGGPGRQRGEGPPRTPLASATGSQRSPQPPNDAHSPMGGPVPL